MGKVFPTVLQSPLADLITGQVRRAAEQVPGTKVARVTRLDEPWDPRWMRQADESGGRDADREL